MQKAQTGMVSRRAGVAAERLSSTGLFKHRATASLRKATISRPTTCGIVHDSKIATARVQPAEARSIFIGKQATVNPVGGSASRLCNFSMWQ
jgi:hypothetical protein